MPSASAYGFFFALAGISAYCAVRFLAASRVTALPRSFSFDCLFALLVISGSLGGRALFILYNIDYFIEFPAEIPALWHGGWVWHGAFAGGLFALIVYARVKKISWLFLADILTPGVALAQGIGRWGNYFNQELYGSPSNLLWAIPIDYQNRVRGYEAYTHFHPTFFYESLFDFALFVLLFFLTRKLSSAKSGTIFALYLIGYSAGRFLIEFLRIDLVPVIMGLRAPQWWSIGLFFAGICILLQVRKKMV